MDEIAVEETRVCIAAVDDIICPFLKGDVFVNIALENLVFELILIFFADLWSEIILTQFFDQRN